MIYSHLSVQSNNLLHYYELHANTSSSPLNLPYQFPPILCETIPSPVRLHATSDMSFGSYGTAIWTDTHTDFGPANRGQRLAGAFLRAGNIQDEEDQEVELLNQTAN